MGAAGAGLHRMGEGEPLANWRVLFPRDLEACSGGAGCRTRGPGFPQKPEAERGALSSLGLGLGSTGCAGKNIRRGIHLLFMWVVTDRNKFSTDLLNPLN